jgi:hypothetical protein
MQVDSEGYCAIFSFHIKTVDVTLIAERKKTTIMRAKP